MAQIIKHRRGTPEQLKTKTLNAAEIGVSTGSLFSGTPIVHIGDGANAAGYVVGRLHYGSTPPTLNSGDIGASYNDMLFHDTDNYILYRTHTDGNANLNLTGNIANRYITGSLGVSGILSASSDVWVGGNLHAVGSVTFEAGSSGNITFGSAAGDNIIFTADVSSSIIPDGTAKNHELGSSAQQWGTVYATDYSGSAATASLGRLEVDGPHLTVDDKGTVSGSGLSTGSFGYLVGDGGGITNLTSAAISTYSNTGNNRIITSVDANEVQGESNLTFDGSTLVVTGAQTVSGVASFASSIDAEAGIQITGSTFLADATAAITHQGGTGLAITSTAGYVDVESIRFTGGNIGISGDTDLLDLQSAYLAINGSLRVDDGATIGNDSDTDLLTLATNKLTVAGETETTTLDVNGGANIAGHITIDKTDGANIQHTGASGNLTISSDNGSVLVEGSTFNGNDLTVPGNFTVKGTTTHVSSSELDIGDNIITVNGFGNAADGGIQVVDASGSAHTGSMLWNAADDYWYSGVSGSTHYRVPQQTSNSALTNNKVLIADSNGRIEPSANITDDGSTIDVNDVDITSIDKLEGVDTNTFIDMGSSDTIETKGNIVPNVNNADTLGTDSKRFSDLYLDGNADIDGTLHVEGAADFAGGLHAQAGLQVSASALEIGSDLKLNYSATSTPRILFQAADETVDFVAAPASTNTNGDTAGEYVRWDGSAFEMTQTIDGGSF